MTANRLFLVCESHPAIEEALCLATRQDAESRYRIAECRCVGKCACAREELNRQRDWFKRHAACGVDRFRLAFSRPQGWDVSPPAQDTVAGAVRLGLVNGNGGES